MIQEDYVSFETAKLLEEKGFDEYCPKSYFKMDKTIKESGFSEWERVNEIKAPTQSLAMKWLRETHNIDIIAPPQYDSIKWTYSAIIFKLSIPCTETRLNDNKNKKEEAVEAAIKYCLENLIKP